VKICPARLDPVFSPRPWGSLSLAPYFPDKSELDEHIGEAWMSGSECVFVDGPYAGKKLGEAWRAMPIEWTGTAIPRGGLFPLLVKLIFPQEKLSVQVHPGDDYAQRHEQAAGGRGKTEMWYAIEAKPGAEVMVGLKQDVTPDSFRRAIADGTAEECLTPVPVLPGDAIFVPAGTAHTIGPGLVLCEIQQHSDLTYRVYDYNRRDAQGRGRELHVEKALEVMRFGQQHGGKVPAVRIGRGGATKTYFVACKYFASEKWEFSQCVAGTTSPERFELLIFLAGNGHIGCGPQRAAYFPAQVWLMPARLGAYELIPESPTSLLRAYVPGDLDRLADAMEQRGVTKEAVARLVYR
jgi:mannose-6-phosphate isomerase